MGWLLFATVGVIALLVASTHQRFSVHGALLGFGVALATGFGIAVAPTPSIGYSASRIAMLGIAIIFLASRPAIARAIFTEAWVAALLSLALFSMFWAPDLTTGATSLAGMLSAVVLGAALALADDRDRSPRLVVFVLFVTSVVSSAAVLIVPQVGTIASWRPNEGLTSVPVGLYGWNSEFGLAAAIGATIALSLATRHAGRGYIALSLIMLGATILSDSATAILAAAIGFACVGASASKLARLMVAVLAVGVGVLAVTGAALGIWENLLAGLGRSSDLTGRTIIWKYVWDLVEERPLLGHGIGAEPPLAEVFGFATHAHNGYLELAYVLGFSGAFVFAISLWLTALRSIGHRQTIYVGLLAIFIVANLANNFLLASNIGMVAYAWAAVGSQRTAFRDKSFPAYRTTHLPDPARRNSAQT